MFPMGNPGNKKCQQEVNGRDRYPETQVCGVQRLLSLHTHGKRGGLQHGISVLPSSFNVWRGKPVRTGRCCSSYVLPTTADPALESESTGAQQNAFPHGLSYCSLPKQELGEGRSCAKHNPAHNPSKRDDGSVQMCPSRPEELRWASHHAAPVVLAWHTSTDVNTFGCASPWRGLWAMQGENSQLWASPRWHSASGSSGELRSWLHLLSTHRAPPHAHSAGARQQGQICFRYLHLQHGQSDCTCHSQSPLGLQGELWGAIMLSGCDRFEPEVKMSHIPFHIAQTMQPHFNLPKKLHFKDNLVWPLVGLWALFFCLVG